MKTTLLIACAVVALNVGHGQDIFMTRSGQVSFFSTTPIENIEAVNNEVSSILNAGTGELVFAVLIKSFKFEKALMEEHFNENYMESAKIPKATFQGRIVNIPTMKLSTNGSWPATVEGDLTIHGVRRHITANGTVTSENGKITVSSTFTILLKDYDVERPALVAEKISEKIDIKVNCRYEPKS